MNRHNWMLAHRWLGLAMTVFLVVVGLTGSLLAFFDELNETLTPKLFPPVRVGIPLDAATLARRAEALVPQARVNSVYLGQPGTAIVRMGPRISPDTGKPFKLNFNQLFLDPISGEELGRRQTMGIPTSVDSLMPFIYRLHYNLALDEIGGWILGIAALVWTIDCFISFYLTLPAMRRKHGAQKGVPATLPEKEALPQRRGFLTRWKPSWLVKWKASAYRINFDLHRAGGLWVWIALLIYAWSSVYMNLHETVYAPATRMALDYPARFSEFPVRDKPVNQPLLDWKQAQETAKRLLSELAALHNFTIERPIGLSLDRVRGIYTYTVRSSRDIQDRRGRTAIAIDANSGELKSLQLPSGQYNGLTVTMWLNALHDANVFGLPYRIFVCVLGLLIVMLSVTGVVIWLKKRRAKKLKNQRDAVKDATPDPRGP